jgi:Xaa-Pro aminopeptidase
MSAAGFPFASRLASVRETMDGLGLDVLLVTHPPNVFYLSGFNGTAGALVVDAHKQTLVVDSRYVTAARALPAEHAGLGEMTVVLSGSSLDEAIVRLLGGQSRTRIGIEAASMPVLRFNRMSSALAAEAPPGSGLPLPVLVPTERVVERSRVVKDDLEIAILRAAAGKLSRVATDTLPRLVQPGRTEAEVASAIDAAVREAGFQRAAFETIVASGPNSALPHARPGLRRLEAGDPVVLDFGGVYDGYCVDLTRTVQLAPQTAEFRRLFAAVADAHRAAVAAVRPGTPSADIDYAARQTLEEHGLAHAFGHGTGHGLGLELHEEPRIAKADPARPAVLVSPGMVFTIEPGAYVPGIGGARIEDDVLVVEGGCEVLTEVPIELV